MFITFVSFINYPFKYSLLLVPFKLACLKVFPAVEMLTCTNVAIVTSYLFSQFSFGGEYAPIPLIRMVMPAKSHLTFNMQMKISVLKVGKGGAAVGFYRLLGSPCPICLFNPLHPKTLVFIFSTLFSLHFPWNSVGRYP